VLEEDACWERCTSQQARWQVLMKTALYVLSVTSSHGLVLV